MLLMTLLINQLAFYGRKPLKSATSFFTDFTDDDFPIKTKILLLFTIILFVYLNIKLRIKWIFSEYYFIVYN